MRLRLACIVVLCLVEAFASGMAYAHPALDEAWQHYEWAEFDEALDALVRAQRAGELKEEELHELLALRATVHFAMREEEAYRRDLCVLASVAPDYRFDRELPPSFHEAWDLARQRSEPLSLHIDVEREPSRLRLRADLRGTATSLVAGPPRVYALVPPDAARRAGSGKLVLTVSERGAVKYWGEATGPGGVVLARSGSPTEPYEIKVLEGAQTRAKTDNGSARTAWFVAGATGAVAVGLAIALGVVIAHD